MVQGSQDSAPQQQQGQGQGHQGQEGGAVEEQEVAETPQETQQGREQALRHSQQQQGVAGGDAAAGVDGEGHAAAMDGPVAAAAAAADVVAADGDGGAAGGVHEAQADEASVGHGSELDGYGHEGGVDVDGDGEEDLEAEELGVTDEDPTSSQRLQRQQQGSVISGSEPQHVHEDDLDLDNAEQQQKDGEHEEEEQQQEEQAGYGAGGVTRPSTFPQGQQLQVKSLLGSSGSPGLRPHSQPMSNIDLNQQQQQQQHHVSPLVPGHPPRLDPFEFRD
jgi:hypothetical protein